MSERLKVDWFDRWTSSLDDALAELPTASTCPPELYRALAQNKTGAQKRTALVTRRGELVAVACMRRRNRHQWQPVTQWITPGIVIPARREDIVPALAALRMEVPIGWWRMGELPPTGPMRDVQITYAHRMKPEGREEFWRKMHHLKDVKQARRRCADLKLTVNAPGAAEWVIRHSEQKWRAGGEVDSGVADQILTAEFLTRSGRYFCLLLSENDEPVAGSTNLLHDDTLTGGTIYRDDSHGNLPTGARLIDAVFDLAAEKGFGCVDLGSSGHHYKRVWAPESGELAQFVVCPPATYYRRRAVAKSGRIARSLPARISRRRHGDGHE